jgi:4-alpha-glucanotransferase
VAIEQRELESRGIWDIQRLVEPFIRVHHLSALFDDEASVRAVVSRYLDEYSPWQYRFRSDFNTERKIQAALPAASDEPTRNKLFELLRNVVLLREDDSPHRFHFRIEAYRTTSFAELPESLQRSLYELYVEYRRMLQR